jgi:hypothetical protein
MWMNGHKDTLARKDSTLGKQSIRDFFGIFREVIEGVEIPKGVVVSGVAIGSCWKIIFFAWMRILSTMKEPEVLI